MPPSAILKRRHSLVGKNILHVVKKMRTYAGQRLNWCRLKSNTALEELSNAELASKFKELTNESAEDILEMSGKELSTINLKSLLHYTILLANETGAPEGQQLVEDNKDEKADDKEKNETEDTGPKKKKKKTGKEDDIQDLKLKVRLIASQNKPSEALLLLTLEELAAKARSLGHEDAETFEELARQATRNQGRINIMSLALTVLGGKASDIITKALSKCMKEKDQEKEESPQNKKHEWQSPLTSLYQPNQMPVFFPPYGYPYAYSGMRQNRPLYGRRQSSSLSSPRQLGPCLFCDGMGHLIKDCTKLKAMKQQK